MKNNIKKIKYLIFVCTLFPLSVFAQIDLKKSSLESSLKSPTSYTTVQEVIAAVLQWVVNIGAVAVTLAFVYVGFQFVASRGNPDGIKKAKESFMWTVVGTLVLLGAQTLALVIKNTLGVS